MEYRKRIHSSIFKGHKLESVIDKKKLLNITLINELRAILKEIKKREMYLHNYWYNLKYFVCALHGVY